MDMILETMWPDIASKCFEIILEQDEVKRAALKESLGKVSKILSEVLSHDLILCRV